MMQTINTSSGAYTFEAVPLYHGRKTIDPLVAASNLSDVNRILSQSGIVYGIIYGTLLGAIRDKSLIPWDEDVDVFEIGRAHV